MRELARVVGVRHLCRIGNFSLAWIGRPTKRLSRYDAGEWSSWQVLWFRLYRHRSAKHELIAALRIAEKFIADELECRETSFLPEPYPLEEDFLEEARGGIGGRSSRAGDRGRCRMIATSRILPDNLYLKEVRDMGRQRLQQKGDLYERGGWWKLRWMEDQIDREGNHKYGWSKSVTLGPSKGPGRLTKPEARRNAWENFLSRLDQNMRTPQSIMTVREFVDRKFIPEHVAMLKPGGRAHYDVHLTIVLDGVPNAKVRARKKVKAKPGEAPPPPPPEIKRHFGIGDLRLRDVTTEDCQRLVSAAVSRGYSVQYATHVRNAISAIFTHADTKDWFNGRNPAKRVNLPEMERRDLHALTFDQATALVAALDSFSATMCLCAMLTSMNVAEILGLRWRRVNLTDQWSTVDGESLPPKHIAVREQWYLREYGSLKKGSRRRNVPVPPELEAALSGLRVASSFAGGDDPVFASRAGTPMDAKNLLHRKILPVARKLGMPWLGWHDLRRTFATLADQVGMSSGERQAVMGHARPSMTARYTRTPSEQARASLEKMATLISGKVN